MVSKTLFVGGLPWSTKEEELKELFSAYGKVEGVRIIRDKRTGRSKGFGFVTFESEKSASSAREGLNNTTLGNRTIKVDWAREKK